MTKKNKGGKRRFPFWIPLAAFLLSLPLLYSSLDYKLFDFFLSTQSSLTESPNVWVLTLDDDSIDFGGGFPFRREVIAEVILLLKELGVRSIAFDLSFLDKSPNRYEEGYARKVFSAYLDKEFEEIDNAAEQFIDAAVLDKAEEEDSRPVEDFSYFLNRARSRLEDALSHLTLDADEYFAQAIQMTGCTWLTLTMIGTENILQEKQDKIKADELNTLEDDASNWMQQLALTGIDASFDTVTPVMFDVIPAIPVLLSRAKGAGTVNAGPDSDGIRRRLQLLLKYHGNYYGNLVLMGMRELLGSPSISVDDSAIILKDALVGGGIRQDIKIPRAKDGSVLLKWPKKTFSEYRQKSLISFIQHTFTETPLAVYLSAMHGEGFFDVWQEEKNPYELYMEADRLKAEALENYSEALFEEWLNARRIFFDAANRYLFEDTLNQINYENEILAFTEGDPEIEEYVKNIFSVCRSFLGLMNKIRSDAAGLDGAFCVIGADATSMTDYGTTPIEENFPNVGTYAVMGNMLISQEFLSEAPSYISILIAFIFSLGIAVITNRFSSGLSIVFGLCGLMLLFGMLLGWFYITKQYIGAAIPFAAALLSFAGITVTNFLGANKDKAFLHSAFSRYLSPTVISELIADPSKLNLGGEKREMTAIFTDIQGFSTFSERLDPAQLVRLLNKYLTAMSNIIMDNGGTVDKYEGDAIIAFFGAPLRQQDHAARACRSALAMKKAEELLNKEVMEEGLCPAPIFTRIGINTGDMVVGNMGAENKMDYTIMGNAVNLAARLEGVNKQYKTGGILISEYTRDKIEDEFALRKLDRVRVVGIKTPVRLFELTGILNELSPEEKEKNELWEKAINEMEDRKYISASRSFGLLKTKSPNDKVAELYSWRSESFIQDPPPADWDGVSNLTEK